MPISNTPNPGPASHPWQRATPGGNATTHAWQRATPGGGSSPPIPQGTTPGGASHQGTVDPGITPQSKWNVSYDASAKLREHAGSSNDVVYRAMKDQFKENNGGAKMPFEMRRALMPQPGSIIDQGSVDRMKRAATGDSELNTHNLNPRKNTLINDKAFVPTSEKRIGAGQHNAVYQCAFRGKDVDGVRRDALTQVHVIKIADKLRLPGGGVASMVPNVGISSNRPRTPDRNVAASKMNERLGTTSVPHATSGMLHGKPCVAMSVAPGQIAKDYYKLHPEIVRNPDFQRQMSDIEVNAFLSGNPDPNHTNLMIGAGADGGVVVTMVDNDMAFGAKMTNPDQPPKFDDKGRSYHHTGLPAYMSAETADKVMSLDVEDFARDLEANLEPDEIGAFKTRADLAKNHVKFLESEGRIVADWANWQDRGGKPIAGDDFFSGTMQMAPVQQGLCARDNTASGPLLTPRSLICRDMTIWNQAAFANFPEAQALKFSDSPLLPPSGGYVPPNRTHDVEPSGADSPYNLVPSGGDSPYNLVPSGGDGSGDDLHNTLERQAGPGQSGGAATRQEGFYVERSEDFYILGQTPVDGAEDGLYNNAGVADPQVQPVIGGHRPDRGAVSVADRNESIYTPLRQETDQPADGLYNNVSPPGTDGPEGLYNNREVKTEQTKLRPFTVGGHRSEGPARG